MWALALLFQQKGTQSVCVSDSGDSRTSSAHRRVGGAGTGKWGGGGSYSLWRGLERVLLRWSAPWPSVILTDRTVLHSLFFPLQHLPPGPRTGELPEVGREDV